MADPPDREVLREMVRRDYERSAGEFAPVFPEFVHLDCDQANTLWLQAFDATAGQMGRGPRWLRVDENGRTGRVEFPDTFRPMRFHGDRVWGVHTGEFDVEHVAWTEVAG